MHSATPKDDSDKSSNDMKSPSTSRSVQSPTHESLYETPQRQIQEPINDESLWKKSSNESEIRARDDEFDEYLADLLL